VYSTFLGGINDDYGYAIEVDTKSNVYVSGITNSPAFPTTSGAYDSIYNGNGDAFVSKLNPTGTALVYSTYLGGSDKDECNGLVVDSECNAYLTASSYNRIASGKFPVFDAYFAF
jgi:hypothetical protein